MHAPSRQRPRHDPRSRKHYGEWQRRFVDVESLERFSNLALAVRRGTKLPSFIDPANLASTKSSTGFMGTGTTTRAGELTATITGRVSVMPNGDLFIIESVREIEINGDRRVVVMTGRGRVADISPSNVVVSTSSDIAADSLLRPRSDEDSLSPGWLIRVLNGSLNKVSVVFVVFRFAHVGAVLVVCRRERHAGDRCRPVRVERFIASMQGVEVDAAHRLRSGRRSQQDGRQAPDDLQRADPRQHARALRRLGAGAQIKVENIAAVLVTAELPAYVRPVHASTSPHRRSATPAVCRAAPFWQRR